MTVLAAIAGLPQEVVGPFAEQLTAEHRKLRVFAKLPLSLAAPYSAAYLDELYCQVAEGLRTASEAKPIGRWELSFVLFFLNKPGDGADLVLEQFGLEALLIPLEANSVAQLLASQRLTRCLDALLADARRRLVTARGVLGVVEREVTNRENRTCVLLPLANFGSAFDEVRRYIQAAVHRGANVDMFERGLKEIHRRLLKNGEGYFIGQNGLVYKTPPKARARHGVAPSWGLGDHTNRCVIRGHLRFGAAFNPNFHYDCHLWRKGGNVGTRFPTCHGTETIKQGRSHVNIAPNDNIR